MSIIRFLKKIFRGMQEEIEYVMKQDPAVNGKLEVFLTYAGLHAIWSYRIANFLYERKWLLLSRIISQLARIFTGIEIHPGAKIGKCCFIDHGSGVVIGETSELGDYVLIYQGVTLGGTGKETGKRHPNIGHHVILSSGSKIIGAITVGDYAKVGAGCVVIKDVPAHSTVVGIPAQVVVHQGIKISSADKYRGLQNEIDDLRSQIDQLNERLSR